MGVVGKVDEPALVVLCEVWSQLLAVDAELAVNSSDAGLQRRANQLRSTLLSYLTAFGCTPVARARVAPPAPPSSDDMNGLLR